MSETKPDNIKRASEILSGTHADFETLCRLAKELKKERAFRDARKILFLARNRPEARKDRLVALKLAQDHALATYKDPDLPAEEKLDRAFEILQEGDDLRITVNQETLGLAGAIFKRRWELNGLKQNLEHSLAYYLRGHEQGVEKDDGYTGINAAFVLDLLADQEEEEARKAFRKSEAAAARRDKARSIREEIVRALAAKSESEPELRKQWWFLATLAEASLGLQDYAAARQWLAQCAELPDVPEWERESTLRQLAQLTRLQSKRPHGGWEGEGSQAWEILREFFNLSPVAMRNIFTGKVGLALSGGGFRASLYHIGVLARLAELDVLRSVDVISCVSGGSIIGAHYYLEVRKLLQEKEDSEIAREDYIEIVKRIARDFLAGVQTNIRTRVAAEWLTNLKMIFSPNYSRTMRVGELYEKMIYSRVEDRPDSKRFEPRWLNELLIKPKGDKKGFNPKNDNWRRAAKVPILILNATTLNTGHNWQFTATWMGEPPSAIDEDVDGNYRLRRLYYREAPEPYQRIRLGHAVAASSCVPGLFEPLALPDLYEHQAGSRKITIRLVDGGVHDNQGVASLLEQGCAVLLVSDASGQMNSEDDPGRGLLSVPLRSSSISQARVRQAQYRELAARRRSSLLQGFMFVHLKLDLDIDPIDWIGCTEPHDTSEDARPVELRGPLTRYGITKEMQEKISGIRTDLDSFSNSEAHALMASGYLMTEYLFPKEIRGFKPAAGQDGDWEFLKLKLPLKKLDRDSKLTKLLKIAAKPGFKIWQLSSPLRVGAIMAGLILVGLLIWTYRSWWSIELFTLTAGALATALVMLVLGKILGPTILRLIRYRKTLQEIAIGLGMSVLGFAAARLHLHVFDRWYLRWGEGQRVIDAAGESDDKP